MTKTDDGSDRLPAGVVLPTGRPLTLPPSRVCPCADCVAAYEALERGELILPDDQADDLPW